MTVATGTDIDRRQREWLLREEGAAELESQHQRMQSAACEHDHDRDFDEILQQHAAAVRNYRMLAELASRLQAQHDDAVRDVEQARIGQLADAEMLTGLADRQRAAFAAQAVASRDLEDLEIVHWTTIEEIDAGLRDARDRAEDAFQSLRAELAGTVALTRRSPSAYSAWDMSYVARDNDAVRLAFPADEHPAVSAGLIVSRMRQAGDRIDPEDMARAEALLRALEQAAADTVAFAAERELHHDAWRATGYTEPRTKARQARHHEQDAAADAYEIMLALAEMADRWLRFDDEDDERGR